MADDRTLIDETNKRFWARTRYKPGQKLDTSVPRDRAMAKIWLEIYAEVKGLRDRSERLALSIYERAVLEPETRTPFIFVGEKPDGSVSHLEFKSSNELLAQFSWAARHPEQYLYAAGFDFAKQPSGPWLEHFEPSSRAPAPSTGHPAALAALATLREQAKDFALRSPANVVGVVRQAPSNQWNTPTFATSVEAADWLGRVRAYPTRFTYAAYFHKAGPMWPSPVDEAIGEASPPTTVSAWY